MRPIQIFLLLSAVALLAGLYKIFEKAGEKGWKALVPGYNFVIWLRIVQKPWWWIFLLLIPTVGFYMLPVMFVLTSNCFGKRKFSQHVFAVVAYFIWIPNLGFSKKAKWLGVPEPEKKRHWAKEWGEAGVFAVIAATLIRTFFFEAFVIPSSSMEGTLLVGDYLFVSKMSYGAKVPAVPLTVPFTHNTLPFTETTPSYFNWIELPYMRLPGFGSVERNDIVVFNFPEGDTVYTADRNGTYYQYLRTFAIKNTTSTDAIRNQMIDEGMIVVHPVDKEDNYVKRCVAVPGDKLEVKNHELYVNDQKAFVSENLQYAYMVRATDLNKLDEVIDKFEIEDENTNGYNADLVDYIHSRGFNHLLQCSVADLKQVSPLCDSILMNEDSANYFDPYLSVFPHSYYFKWNKDNFGPLIIPKKGMTVHLSLDSLPLWYRAINVYEGNQLEIKDRKIYINGSVASTYTFQRDYYWMMGDNRHNSLDSRYWGYVPDDHIVGKPVFVWNSRGKHGFRTDRMMAFVSKDGLSQSYLWWVLGGIAAIWGFSYWRNRNKPKESKKPASKKK